MRRIAPLVTFVVLVVAAFATCVVGGGGDDKDASYSARCAAGEQTTYVAGPTPTVDWSRPEKFVVYASEFIARYYYLTPVDRGKLLEAAWQEAARDERLLPEPRPAPVNVTLTASMSLAEKGEAVTEGFTLLADEMRDSPSEKPFFYSVIGAMARSLQDPHTYFLPPEYWGPYFEGLIFRPGFLWTDIDNGYVITDVQSGSPADLAGLQPGDTILRSPQDPTQAFEPRDADESVKLRIKKRVDGQETEVELKNGRVPWLKSEMLNPGIGYIRLYQFPFSVSCETLNQERKLFEDALADLKQQGAKGWVLDLRDDGGGSSDTAGFVASRFGFDGLFLTLRRDTARQPVELLGDDATGGAPLVILVNGNSASASEIVAYDLQQDRHAYVIGTQSKGAVVTTSPHDLAGGALFISSAFVDVGPGNKVLDHVGVAPDKKVELDTAQLVHDGSDNQLAAALDYLAKKRGK